MTEGVLGSIAYGLLASVTPALVLVNSVLISTASESVRPLRSLSLAHVLMFSEPMTMANAYRVIALPASDPTAPARIIHEGGSTIWSFIAP